MWIMNRKKAIVMRAIDFLENEQFSLSLAESKNSCYDVLARRRSFLMVLKFLFNIDSFSGELAGDLKELSTMFSAYPLLIGEKTRHFNLQDGVLHHRYGVNAVNLRTFMDIFSEGVYPAINSMRGGYYARIDGENLKEIRSRENISFGELSEHLGVSRTMIYSYENSGLGMTLSTVIKLEEFLDAPLALPLEVFIIPSLEKRDIPLKDSQRAAFTKLEKIGFEIHPIRRAPFDAVTKGDDELMITKVDRTPKKTLKEIRVVKEVSNLASCFAFVITDTKDAEKNVEGVPVIKGSELDKIESQRELLETLEQRR
jgi:putative transcriptional regulator